MIDNRQLITKKIEELADEIKKMDIKILKEAKPFQNGNVYPQNLLKIGSLGIERDKLLHTQTAFFAILGQWKSE